MPSARQQRTNGKWRGGGRGALAGVLALMAVVSGLAAAERQPNVVLILADDLAPGDLGIFNGGKTSTPEIDRLFRESVQFGSAYSASPVCAPARAALLTGRWPHRTGVVSLEMKKFPGLTRLKADERTVAEAFRAAGYVTGLIGKWHAGDGPEFHPLRRGFDEFEGFFGSDPVGFHRYPFDVQGTMTETTGKYLTDDLTERAVAFLRRHRERPFFLKLAHYAPHRPLEAPAERVRAYVDKGYDEKIATIHAMVEVLDRGVGRVREELERLGLARDTVVLFTSDNGPDPIPGGRANLGLRGMKYEVYEGGIRVPLAVCWPGRFAPQRTEAVVHFVDFYPTLAELAGVPVLPGAGPIDGKSFLPVLTGATDRTEGPWYWQWSRGVPNYTHNAAMRDGPWKLVLPYVTRAENPPDSRLAPVLYDLSRDPGETTDMADQQPERTARMTAQLRAWMRAVEAERLRPAAGMP
jgi:arylsulfatase A